jgi:hypothetical protein
MKPLHIGLLLVGVALASGLAVKMTQPPPIPVAPLPVVQPLIVKVPKPRPIPEAPPVVPAPARVAAAFRAERSPAPVYDEPAKPAIRKNKPILIASAKPPTQWTPGPYQAPLTPAAPVTPTPAPVAPPALAPAPVPVPTPRQVTLRTGMTIPVRLDESVSTDRSVAGDTFQASLAEPLAVDGLVIAEKGARVTGRIVDSQKAGNVTGAAILELGLANLMTSDGQRVTVSTDPWRKLSHTVPQYTPANVPSKTIIQFRLAAKVTVTERRTEGDAATSRASLHQVP